MKGKMKKIIAGIATLAMAAQFAFVLPASAADPLYSTDFNGDNAVTTGWTSQFCAAGLSIAKSGDNTYLEYKNGSGGGPRSAYFVFPSAAQVKAADDLSVAELDFSMNLINNGKGNCNQLGLFSTTEKPIGNGNYGNTDYAILLTQPRDSSNQIMINEGTATSYAASSKTNVTTGYTNGSWAHLTAIMNYTDKTVIVAITSLDGNTSYFGPKMISMGDKATQLGQIFLCPERNGETICVDNIKVRAYDAAVDGTYYTVQYVDGEGTTKEAVKAGTTPVNIPSNPLKMGGYKFTGKWKDTATNTEYTPADLAELEITSDMTFEAQFEVDPSAIEKMASMSIKTHPVLQPVLPVKSDDGSDNSVEYPVELSIIGEAGNELTAEDYPYAKGELTVTWEIGGFDSLKGNSTGEPDTRADGTIVYCDSYMELTGFSGNATKGTIKLTSGIGNYFGKFKVKVKYGNSSAGYVELEDEFPMIILADTNKAGNQIYPLGGYFENLNWYSDSIVGYNSYSFSGSNNANNPDPYLSGWCTWGGSGTKEMSLQKDTDTGDKYLHSSGAKEGTSFAAFEMGSVGEQAYIDTDVKFSASGEALSLRHKGGRNADDLQTAPEDPDKWAEEHPGLSYKVSGKTDVSYRAIHTTPYSHNISFNGSALSYGENTITGLEAEKWYRVRISFDDSAQEFWYQVWEIDDTKRLGEEGRVGSSLGKTDAIPYSTEFTSLPYVMNYFTLCPSSNGNGIYIKNTTITKPDMTTFTATTDAETITIPEGADVTVTPMNSEKNTVKVKAEKSAVTAEVANKTADSEKVNAFVACYNDNSGIPVKVTKGTATIAAGASKTISVDVPTDVSITERKLYVWTDKMEPLIEAKDFELDTSTTADPTAKLSTIKKDADGNDLSGNVTWSLAEDYDGVSIAADEENPNNAVVTVKGSASPGTIYAIASNRGQTARVAINLTGSADSVSFLNPTTSVTIPFDDTPSTATYSAEVRTGTGETINGKDVTFAMYDANNAQVLANTDAVSFDPLTATLTVTKDAKGQVVYIRGTSTNSEGETISKSVKVTIHGLSFDFGASDEEGVHEGYTAVTPSTAYTEDRGYGISGSATAGGSAATDDLDGDYIEATGDMTFRVKVPEGKNYKLKVTYKGAMSTEAISTALSGVNRATNTALTRSEYNVAVIGDSLDFKVTDGQIASVEIEMLSAPQAGDKPTWFTYGDSTTNSSSGGKIGWANVAQQYTTKFNVRNTAKSGSNPQTFYNNGNMDGILLSIAEGDLVTFNGMGTNNYTATDDELKTLIKACQDRGAYVIMTTYTPHGPTGNYSDRYHSNDQTFHGARDTDGYTIGYRRVAEALGLQLVDFGKMGDDEQDKVVDAASTTDATAREAAAQEVIAHWLDHNHTDAYLADLFAKVYVPAVETAFDALIAD